MKKSEFIKAAATRANLSLAQTERALTAIIETVQDELLAGERRSTVPGLGTFRLVEKDTGCGFAIRFKAAKGF